MSQLNGIYDNYKKVKSPKDLSSPNLTVLIMKVVDCIGLYCPEPVFMARKAIEDANVGEIIEIHADDPASEQDIPVLINKLGQELLKVEKDGDVFKFVVRISRKVR